MPIYRERLWPSPWVFISTALVIPASLLVFLPISMLAGIVCAIVLYGAVVITLILTTPTVVVTDDTFAAGRAQLPRTAVEKAEPFEGLDATAQRGTSLDARAWLLLRGWIPGVVRVDLNDPDDPTPYWLISTRRPKRLAAALSSQRSER